MKRLPHGIQTFEKIIEGDYLYVDKTAEIHRLLTTAGSVVFLSRPRRFGKSLLCSALGSLFEGKRELFKGLAIDELDWKWIEYPVIHIDLNAEDYLDGRSALLARINSSLKNSADKYGVTVSGDTVSTQFESLIIDLHRKYQQKVVVIVDEYDKPLLGTIDAPEIHKKLRGVLKGFFGVLKSADAYLKFSFITGVTKFSKVSIFSDLNQLDDITFKPAYAAICGITQDELERDFSGDIEEYAKVNKLSAETYKKNLKDFYNGYRFTEKDVTVYNPFGLISHFMNDGKFDPYWFNSGTPTFLYHLIKDQHIDVQSLDNLEVSEDSFIKFDIEDLQAVPILYQSGYLTIKDYTDESNSFTLGFPNEEVSSAFSKHLLKFMFPRIGNIFVDKFSISLKQGKIEEAMQGMKEFLSGIPYDIQINDEHYYQTVFHIIFTMFGLDSRSELRTASGRIDTLVETKNYVYCFEFKLNSFDSSKRYTAAEALAQIDSKEYLTPWSGSGKKAFKVGVVFDFEKRNISEWETVIYEFSN